MADNLTPTTPGIEQLNIFFSDNNNITNAPNDQGNILFDMAKKRIGANGVWFANDYSISNDNNSIVLKKDNVEVSRIDNLSKFYIGVSTSAANTYQKTAEVEEFPVDANNKPIIGTVVAIKWTVTNTYKTANKTYTLNVNNTGEYPIYYDNKPLATATSANTLAAGYLNRYVMYMFDGTNWVWCEAFYNTNTTYAVMTEAEGQTATATTGRLVTAQRLKNAIQYHNLTDSFTEDVYENPGQIYVWRNGSNDDVPTKIYTFQSLGLNGKNNLEIDSFFTSHNMNNMPDGEKLVGRLITYADIYAIFDALNTKIFSTNTSIYNTNEHMDNIIHFEIWS